MTATIAGALVGFLSVAYVGATINVYTPLTTAATVVLFATCPVIHSIWWSWWLVPVLNAMLYGCLAFGIAKWRLSHK
jgi:hypothetical protein